MRGYVMVYIIIFISLFTFLYVRINRFMSIIQRSIATDEFSQRHASFEGYVVLIEERNLIRDLSFYRNIFSVLEKKEKLLIVKINFEDESTYEALSKLLTYFNVYGVTSIYYHNPMKRKLIYDLSQREGLNKKDVYAELNRVLNGEVTI